MSKCKQRKSEKKELVLGMFSYPLKDRKRESKYKIRLIEQDGVTCISVEGGNLYNINNRKEPKPTTCKTFKAKFYKRFTILKKLGLWENGRILPREKKLV
jgi:hypothetical protein